MLNRRLTRAAAAVAAASILSVWSPQIGYELGLSSSNRAQAAPAVAPTGLKLDVGDTRLFPYWTANTDAGVVGYKVTYVWLGVVGVLLGGSKTVSVPAPATSTTLTGLTNGTSYSVQVTAVYSDGSESSASTQLSATPNAPGAPLQPTNLATTVADTAVPLTWSLPTDPNRKRVDVYRNGAFLASMANAGTQAWTDTTVTNGRTYSYQVVAVNTALNPLSRSDYSASATGSPFDLTPPVVPVGLTAAPTDKRINLSWTANGDSDFDHYLLNGASLSDVSVTGNSYSVSGLTNGTNYTFTLSAVDKVGNKSGTTSVTAKPVDNVAPDVPTGLVVQASDSTLNLTWNASAATDTSTYRIYVNGALRTTVPAGTTSTALTGLTNGIAYQVQVTAADAVPNESPKSTSVYGTPVDLTAPSAPTGFVGTAGDGQATFTWNGSPEADVNRYVVRRSGSTTTLAAVGKNVTTATVTGLVNGTPGSFVVVAIDNAGNESTASNVATVTPRDMTPPAAPVNLTGTAEDTSVTLSWNANSESDFDHYVVRNGSGATVATVTKGTQTVRIGNLANDTAASFTVVAVDTVGNVSASSNAVSLTPKDTTAPSAPTNVVATAGDGRATLTWTRSPEADVARYLVKNSAGTTVATVTGGATSTTITGLTNDTAYTYTVVAVDTSGNTSTESGPVSVTPKDTTAPSAPSNATGTAGDRTATVSWTRSPETDVDRYLVRDSSGATVATVGATGSTATVTGLTNGTSYVFTVVAVDRAGNVSPASATVPLTPKDTTPPPAPSAAGSTAGNSTVTVTWTGSTDPDVDHYEVLDPSGTTRATAPAGSSSATVSGLTNGTAYTFSVVAVDAAGNRSNASTAPAATPGAAGRPWVRLGVGRRRPGDGVVDPGRRHPPGPLLGVLDRRVLRLRPRGHDQLDRHRSDERFRLQLRGLQRGRCGRDVGSERNGDGDTAGRPAGDPAEPHGVGGQHHGDARLEPRRRGRRVRRPGERRSGAAGHDSDGDGHGPDQRHRVHLLGPGRRGIGHHRGRLVVDRADAVRPVGPVRSDLERHDHTDRRCRCRVGHGLLAERAVHDLRIVGPTGTHRHQHQLRALRQGQRRRHGDASGPRCCRDGPEQQSGGDERRRTLRRRDHLGLQGSR